MKDTSSKSDIYKALSYSKRRRLGLFRQLPTNEQAFILLDLSRRVRNDIVSQLKDEELLEIVRYLDPASVTEVLRGAQESRRERLIGELSEDLKNKVERLLQFDPRTAAGLMSVEYIEVPLGSSFSDVGARVREHEKKTGRFPTILVVQDGYLSGELLGHTFALAKEGDQIGSHVRKVPHISYTAEEKAVLQTFKKHPHDKVVVLDDNGSIMGVIYSDEILRLLRSKQTQDLYDFAGVADEEDVLDSAFDKVKYRYRWLIINLGTAFLAASVVSLFEDTISKVVLLAVYMPIVAGMGGNAGTQTLAVVVRGLALKEVDLAHSRNVIRNEMAAGAINGLINGLIVAAIATIFNQSPLLGVVLGVAMVVNLVIAGLFGAVIPLIMQKLGKDPASSATIFITTATDVFGFFVFLGLARLLLV